MAILSFIIKAYIVILMFRYAATRRELAFNPVGKTVAMLTDPVFKKFKVAEEQSNRFIPMLVLAGIIIAALLNMLFTRSAPVQAVLSTVMDFLLFFMIFFIVSVFLGSLTNKPAAGPYVTYFFRLGVPWVKLTRTFIPISGGGIIYPAAIVIFLLYVCSEFVIMTAYQAFSAGFDSVAPIRVLLFSVKTGLLGLTDIIYYLCWVVIARALMSWVSPDGRNPVVQLIYTVTEPVLAPFRRIIPTVGIFDLSAFAAIIVLSFGASVLSRLIAAVF